MAATHFSGPLVVPSIEVDDLTVNGSIVVPLLASLVSVRTTILEPADILALDTQSVTLLATTQLPDGPKKAGIVIVAGAAFAAGSTPYADGGTVHIHYNGPSNLDLFTIPAAVLTGVSSFIGTSTISALNGAPTTEIEGRDIVIDCEAPFTGGNGRLQFHLAFYIMDVVQ